ncbi:penicillin acylase family protein [Xanthomonas sp. 1678]|uniref:penicillin acylase family protein n=1 Tax=Xanthomonas sp. 1678 TaxID=3158788 RepID=UPI00286C6AC8
MPRTLRIFRTLVLAFVVLLLALALGIYALLRMGTAQLNGSVSDAGVRGAVAVQRDASGTVTLRAGSRRDAVFALGFVHGQERFFSMDLMRRGAAGELSQLLGPMALPMDRQRRQFRMRSRAQAALAGLPASQREELQAYRDGVNSGLRELTARPWEYWVFRQPPAQWNEEDSLLVLYAMYFELNDASNGRELAFARIQDALGPAVRAFLSAAGGPLDAPLTGAALPTPPVPPAADFDTRRAPSAASAAPVSSAPVDRAMAGSNAFAVGGALTASRAAMVGNDMHLGLGMPNLWFRARLQYPVDEQPATVDINGLTLPGAPPVVVGSNRFVAWGFTNSFGDWTDWVRVRVDPARAEFYASDAGWERFNEVRETIHVRGGADEILTVRETRWGPLIARDSDGVALAIAWTALLPGAVNLRLGELDRARDVGQALEIASAAGIPAQNFVVGDRAGNIGWTIAGSMPLRRTGGDPVLPADWSLPGHGWDGLLPAAAHPRIVNPASARLWSANARALDPHDAGYALIGDGGYDLGARAGQIRDDLSRRNRFAEADFLAIQLDDRAPLMDYWRELLKQTLARASARAPMRRLQPHVDSWNGHAAVDSVGYRAIRQFRQEVTNTTLGVFADRIRERDKDFYPPAIPQGENLVRRLLQERPAHLLPAHYRDYDAMLTACADKAYAQLAGNDPDRLAARTWGEENTVRVRHLLSGAIPGASWLLDMPDVQAPGDLNLPRVQGAYFGATERFAVQPGHEEKGYLHMPPGQSGNPLSPFYGAGHDAWVKGTPTPFLPGATVYTLTLQRAR